LFHFFYLLLYKFKSQKVSTTKKAAKIKNLCGLIHNKNFQNSVLSITRPRTLVNERSTPRQAKIEMSGEWVNKKISAAQRRRDASQGLVKKLTKPSRP